MIKSLVPSVRLLQCRLTVETARRSLFRPPRETAYRGIYRTDGERCMQDELLVCQKKLNYHPGLNVYMHRDRGLFLLKSCVDGHVMISRGRINPDISIPENEYFRAEVFTVNKRFRLFSSSFLTVKFLNLFLNGKVRR